MEDKSINQLTEKVIGLAMQIHRALGPGLLESAYHECLCYELKESSIDFQREMPLPVKYKGVSLDCGYRIDIMVDKQLIIELKAVEKMLPIHQAQLLTYLKMTDCRLGLLINFNVPLLKNGICRIANKL